MWTSKVGYISQRIGLSTLYLACKGDERSAVFHHAEFDVSKYYVKNKIVGIYEMV
jgi:hypothetical protein